MAKTTSVPPESNATVPSFLRRKEIPAYDPGEIYGDYNFKYAVIERLDAVVDLLGRLVEMQGDGVSS